jgi:hypothetical protein
MPARTLPFLAPLVLASVAVFATDPALAQGPIDSLTTVVRREPGNGLAWLRLGSALAQAERLPAAEEAFRRADSLGTARLIARYNVAALSARQGRPDSARAWLARAFAVGYGDFAGLAADDDFASLRGDARFDTLVAGARSRTFPCGGDPRHRAFDFWIGEWDVMANGVRVGTNTITRELEGCALYERWKAHPATGSYGHSVNRFDPAGGKWHQLWIDANGTQTDYEGEVVADGIRFLGVSVAPDGTKQRSEMTFTRNADGTVRQFIRTAPMDREEWTTAFDAMYVPRR